MLQKMISELDQAQIKISTQEDTVYELFSLVYNEDRIKLLI